MERTVNNRNRVCQPPYHPAIFRILNERQYLSKDMESECAKSTYVSKMQETCIHDLSKAVPVARQVIQALQPTPNQAPAN